MISAHLDPLISEFETEAQAAEYELWFEAKVLEAMHSTKPRLSHDEAMARLSAELADRRQARADPPLE